MPSGLSYFLGGLGQSAGTIGAGLGARQRDQRILDQYNKALGATPGINPYANQQGFGTLSSGLPQQPLNPGVQPWANPDIVATPYPGNLGALPQQQPAQQPVLGALGAQPNPLQQTQARAARIEQAKQAEMALFNRNIIGLALEGPKGQALANRAIEVKGAQFTNEAANVLQSAGSTLNQINTVAATAGPEAAMAQFQYSLQNASPQEKAILGMVDTSSPQAFIASSRELARRTDSSGVTTKLAIESAAKATDEKLKSQLEREEIAVQAGFDQKRKETAQPPTRKEELEFRKMELDIAKLMQEMGVESTKQADLERKAKTKKDILVRGADSVIGLIDKATEQTEGFATTGVAGAVTRGLPATPAFDLNKTVETIKANVGFDKLQSMRDASPTGGALGQVSERELSFLQSTIANLDTAQSEDQLLENLNAVKTHYQNMRDVLNGKMPDGYDAEGNPLGQQQAPITAVNPKTGERIISRDGGETWEPN